MPAVFLVSDTHFGHKGVCHFMGKDGETKLRPWDTAEEMDDCSLAEFHPDFPIKAREECRRLRSDAI